MDVNFPPFSFSPHEQNNLSPATTPTTHKMNPFSYTCRIGGGLGVVCLLVGVVLLYIPYRKKGRVDYSPSKQDNGLRKKNTSPMLAHLCPSPRAISTIRDYSSQDSDSGNQFSRQAHSGLSFGSSSIVFSYEEIVAATDGFSETNLVGEGGFGYVHKGVLPNGKEIAVKRMKMESRQGDREFRAEVETLTRVHHKHLVSLLGYCFYGAERLIVYEFVPNKTLDFHLHGKGQPIMEWGKRLKIAIGSAKGLAYLHEECDPTIIHRDIKASNILIDSNFEAKVSDFGLAKFFSDATTRVVGTVGYLDPEYVKSGKASDKSDVFSYGVMLLELITGHRPVITAESSSAFGLVNWAKPLLWKALEEKTLDTLVDPRLENKYDKDEMNSMISCAAAAVRKSAWRRPKMSQIVRAIECNFSPTNLELGLKPGQSLSFNTLMNQQFGDVSDVIRRMRAGEDSNGSFGSNSEAIESAGDNIIDICSSSES